MAHSNTYIHEWDMVIPTSLIQRRILHFYSITIRAKPPPTAWMLSIRLASHIVWKRSTSAPTRTDAKRQQWWGPMGRFGNSRLMHHQLAIGSNSHIQPWRKHYQQHTSKKCIIDDIIRMTPIPVVDWVCRVGSSIGTITMETIMSFSIQ